MKRHIIAGGGGIPLQVVETGNGSGRSILFLHGFSQCWLTWSRQLSSDLAISHRLIAMDLRGHGQSGKPRNAYGDSKLWADDVHAVIETLKLDSPILCGWSYAPLIILDYIRHYGDERIGGLHFVDGITRLGSEEATAVITPAFLTLIPGFFSNDAEESVRSLGALFRICVVNEPPAEEMYLMLGFAVSTPPHVREAMFSRSIDNDDLLPQIRKPVLITHGVKDVVVSPAVVDQHKAGMKHAQIHLMENVGHAPFWDDAVGFNHRLRTFSEG
jgi:non-heme chloroperoxidase